MEYRRQSINMTKRRRGTFLEDIHEWIVIEEILVRLPPTDLLRCRAVRKMWHGATSTNKFMLDNYRRQPSLPVIKQHLRGQEEYTGSLSSVTTVPEPPIKSSGQLFST